MACLAAEALPVTTMDDPDHARALLARAQLLIEAGRPREALPLVWRARSAAPDSGRPCCYEAWIHLNLDEPKRAAVAAKLAIHADPQAEWAHRLLSHAMSATGESAGALLHAETALRLAPEKPETLLNAHHRYWDSGEKEKARAVAARLLALFPDEADTHQLLGRMALREKRWVVAEGYLRQALRLNASCGVSMQLLGISLQNQGRKAEALDCFHQAARLNPQSESARSSLLHSAQAFTNPLLGWALAGLAGFLLWGNLHRGRNPAAVLVGVLLLAAVVGGTLWWRRDRTTMLHPQVLEFMQDEERRAAEPYRSQPLVMRLCGWGMAVSMLWLLGVTLFGSAVIPHPLEYVWAALLLSSGGGAVIYRWWLDAEERR